MTRGNETLYGYTFLHRLSAAWLTSALVIPCLSAFGRPLQHWAYQNPGETAVAWVISLLLIGLGLAAIRWLADQTLNGKRYTLVLITIALVLAFTTIIAILPRTEERLHFVTFGLFGFLSRRLFPTWSAVIVSLAWAGGDELFQAWLPDRVGDWRDVGMNTVAAVMGMGLAWLGKLKPSGHSPTDSAPAIQTHP